MHWRSATGRRVYGLRTSPNKRNKQANKQQTAPCIRQTNCPLYSPVLNTDKRFVCQGTYLYIQVCTQPSSVYRVSMHAVCCIHPKHFVSGVRVSLLS